MRPLFSVLPWAYLQMFSFFIILFQKFHTLCFKGEVAGCEAVFWFMIYILLLCYLSLKSKNMLYNCESVYMDVFNFGAVCFL